MIRYPVRTYSIPRVLSNLAFLRQIRVEGEHGQLDCTWDGSSRYPKHRLYCSPTKLCMGTTVKSANIVRRYLDRQGKHKYRSRPILYIFLNLNILHAQPAGYYARK